MKKLLLLTLSLILFAAPALAFPDNGVLDAFTGCTNDATPPNANWTNAALLGGTTANLECRSEGVSSVSAASGEGYYSVQQYGRDCEAYVTIVDITNASNGWVYCRLQNIGANTTDGYAVAWVDATSIVGINRIDNGVDTGLGANFTQTITAGDKIGIRAVGDQICAWYNAAGAGWAQLGCRTDSTYMTGGYLGTSITQTTANNPIHDDFGGGNVATPKRGVIFLQ